MKLAGSRLRASWAVMAVVLVVSLGFGARDAAGPATDRQRVARIASTVRCPTCKGLSAAESDARAAVAVREEIARRVRAGESDGEVRAFLAGRYGRDILLTPESRGLPALVWAIPAAGLVVGAAGLAMAFRRWRRRLAGSAPDADDRALVEAALRGR